MAADKHWDRESIESVKAVHHDPSFKGPNLSDKAEGNGMKIRFAGNVTGKQVTAVLGLLATLITAYAGYMTRVAKGDNTAHTPQAQVQAVGVLNAPIPQMETQLATHEVRLNNVDRILQQHEAHDERIDGKLDKLIEGQNALAVSVARLKPAKAVNGGGSQ